MQREAKPLLFSRFGFTMSEGSCLKMAWKRANNTTHLLGMWPPIWVSPNTSRFSSNWNNWHYSNCKISTATCSFFASLWLREKPQKCVQFTIVAACVQCDVFTNSLTLLVIQVNTRVHAPKPASKSRNWCTRLLFWNKTLFPDLDGIGWCVSRFLGAGCYYRALIYQSACVCHRQSAQKARMWRHSALLCLYQCCAVASKEWFIGITATAECSILKVAPCYRTYSQHHALCQTANLTCLFTT